MRCLTSLTFLVVTLITASVASAQTAREVRGAAAVEPVVNEPPAKITVDPPLAEALSHGRVVIQYRAENLHIAPVFGAAAVAVSPRIGHVHVTVDDAVWVWADASGEPVILNGLAPGPHKVRIQLENANHHLLDERTVKFTVPKTPAMNTHAPVAQPKQSEPPAKLVIETPLAEPLARGVAFIPYHADNAQLVPVYGPEALAIVPRVGHVHVTVDGASWHWADPSGQSIIIQGLTPGRHTVLIELVDADHHALDRGTVELTIPAAKLAHMH